mgnify:FL=1
MKLKLYIIFLISPFFLTAQDNASVEGELPAPLSKIEQLILDIESEIDIEKRFDFSRSNSKEKQLADLKRIHKKVKSDLEAAENLSRRLIVEFDENEKILSEFKFFL